MNINDEIVKIEQQIEELREALIKLSDKQNSQYTDIMLELRSIIDKSENVEEELDDDELYEEAVEIVREAKKASASLLQRRLKIGYAKAAMLLDLMEERGVIGPGDGAKPRAILKKTEEETEE
ncbi:MAG: DNA translocase FtsK [bacterium]|nr:DNA translocase FtsK [bacterium]